MTTPRLRIVSAGTLHGGLPTDVEWDLIINMTRFRDPLNDPALRELTGKHLAVREHVLNTPGVANFLYYQTWAIAQLLSEKWSVNVGVLCRVGRHRSVVVADCIGKMQPTTTRLITTKHLHIDCPVVLTTKDNP